MAGCVIARATAAMPGGRGDLPEASGGRRSFRRSGTGLNIGPNGLKALKRHSPELADAVLASSFLWHSWRTSLTDGTVLFDLPLDKVADNPGIRIRWSELYRVLRVAAGACVRFNCEVDGGRLQRSRACLDRIYPGTRRCRGYLERHRPD